MADSNRDVATPRVGPPIVLTERSGYLWSTFAVNRLVVGSSPTCRASTTVTELTDRPVNGEPREIASRGSSFFASEGEVSRGSVMPNAGAAAEQARNP